MTEAARERINELSKTIEYIVHYRMTMITFKKMDKKIRRILMIAEVGKRLKIHRNTLFRSWMFNELDKLDSTHLKVIKRLFRHQTGFNWDNDSVAHIHRRVLGYSRGRNVVD